MCSTSSLYKRDVMFLILKTMYIVLIHWFKGAPEIVAVQRTRQYHV